MLSFSYSYRTLSLACVLLLITASGSQLQAMQQKSADDSNKEVKDVSMEVFLRYLKNSSFGSKVQLDVPIGEQSNMAGALDTYLQNQWTEKTTFTFIEAKDLFVLNRKVNSRNNTASDVKTWQVICMIPRQQNSQNSFLVPRIKNSRYQGQLNSTTLASTRFEWRKPSETTENNGVESRQHLLTAATSEQSHNTTVLVLPGQSSETTENNRVRNKAMVHNFSQMLYQKEFQDIVAIIFCMAVIIQILSLQARKESYMISYPPKKLSSTA